MSEVTSKPAYVRWIEEVVSRGDLAVADELVAPGYRVHFPGLPEPLDVEGHKGLVTLFRSAFADWHDTIEDVIVDGDRVAMRITGEGTHTGDFQGIPPTGRRATVGAIVVGRMEGDRIAEAWAQLDMLGLLRQLGAIPVEPA